LQDFSRLTGTPDDGTHFAARTGVMIVIWLPPATAATSLRSETDAIDPETGQLAPLFNPQT